MSPQRRRRPGTYRPPRDRKEIAIAVLCAVGVVVLTAALLFVLRPRDDTPSSPPVSVPLPTDQSLPVEDTLPPETLVPEPDTGVTEAPPAP